MDSILLNIIAWPLLVVSAYGLQILKMTAGTPRFSRMPVMPSYLRPVPFLQPQQTVGIFEVADSFDREWNRWSKARPRYTDADSWDRLSKEDQAKHHNEYWEMAERIRRTSGAHDERRRYL